MSARNNYREEAEMRIYGVEMTPLRITENKVTLIAPNGSKMEMSRAEFEDRKTW